ncbi:hypothetical protein J4211_05780 [Candidatus Woesearchaeota archaeon]|nr:hypothetical protein [Candidatus Woesearchaeota archaeon]
MNFKKLIGGVSAVICTLFLILVAAQVITWNIFWLAMILLGGLAYLVLPRLE